MDDDLSRGKFGFGCEHYSRRCRIRAPCCDLTFTCRHCHNEAADNSQNPHVLDRLSAQKVVCFLCGTEQEVAQICSNCGVCMGDYFCDICKFFDDDTSKEQFHCPDCRFCRAGGRDNFFHC